MPDEPVPAASPPPPVAVLAAVGVHLPERTVDVREAERALAARNPGAAPRVPMVSRLTGVRRVHVLPDEWDASDLAAAAAEKLLAAEGLGARDVDLLLFASASQDMVEPATSHIVAAKLGVRAPVMDVKNACNSVLNAIEVAEALVATGRYGTVLIACGEAPSRAVRWDVPDRATYLLSAPGYTMSDAGAAVLVRRATPAEARARDVAGRAAPRGILASAFGAESTHWDVGMLPGGGTAHPRDLDRTYFEIDGSRLRDAFLALGPGVVLDALRRARLTWDDVALVAVHQVAVAYLDDVHAALGLPTGRTLVTVADHGNVASATLPLQLATALETGRVGPGDVVVLVGLAGGISIGATVVRL
ncbi:3-oxoacyl-ACP synthase III family protein [Cellulosimicrobium marinum]|uniref:3-oxoacyl-ACP synthase III family protein n=1 Tax=Cellulosimicrobium marinum TaxID=1638992 RepID=UPI001E45D7EE|nr:3-oxoacyl-[acyl-carrier-protein] synthase III C-terminal domain-containing protein [Cellulosimicrobium marinum]MCB7137867.1 ketoacyl-ACP synthase III [Cellulosimicrobium marinum]